MTVHIRNAFFASALMSSALFGLSRPAMADITVGAILPLTGTSASIGEDQRRGVELAVDQVNAQGGVDGQKLAVIVEDSAGNPVTALDAVRKLTQVDHVPLVVGAFSSSVTIPIGQYLVKNHLVHINISGTSTDIRKIGKFSYSVIGLDDLSARFSAKDVYAMGYRKVAFIAPNGAYGQGMAEQFTKFFQQLGGKVVAKTLYTSGQSSYRRELEQLSRYKPDVYVYTTYGQDAVVLNRESYELGLNKTPWYGMYLTMCTANSPAQYTQGKMGMEVAGLSDKGQRYTEQYRKRYNENPKSAYGSYAYDSIMLAAAAINKAGSADPAALQTAMLAVAPHFVGVTGPLNLDADHMRQTQPYEKVKSVNGALAPR
ncbi:ABC transporter substrate-binding protein [Pectobacteriaceae bacterium CE70]|nr:MULTISPECIES: ABC transporter substrate-binding protein [Enterobacterales]WJV58755.1 ABC transporter substrate-binding protein [Pectobacteriaceae bacterium C111]WJV63070.1 ABC transporter substrate-binding protein [Pectobacteriaceae bacterium C52]WJV67392.1 ABC transporter substrate-binding protein [Pectobacteriaceae bacterium CE70]WJY11373.1 ABC transporter substrate-binding protein [Pectobacteriaceae bacterium C80]WJV54394.1 ABC transporter substrate-binding protein [Prodigiosinella sp. L